VPAEIGETAVERGQCRVVPLGDGDAEALLEADHEVEEVHRVEVEPLLRGTPGAIRSRSASGAISARTARTASRSAE
jgi:hypothetical protein